jgi:DNA polymerase-1
MTTLRDIHDFELALVEPVMAALQRGIQVDEARRTGMIAALEADIEPLREGVNTVAIDVLKRAKKIPKEALFRERWTCPCCRGAKNKSQHCWTCGGFDCPPTKRDMVLAWEADKKLTKAELEERLPVCRVCGGEGKREQWSFNPASHEQLKIMLYSLLQLPRRMRRGKLRSDEEALKELRPFDKSDFINSMLKINKATTIIQILRRIQPGADGRLRTWLNVAGTETGRFSSSETFLVDSTNLQNMPKRAAALDAKYEVRQCIVPMNGHALIEADLSQAEARVVAALCKDERLLTAWEDPEFDVHRWTAGHIFNKPAVDVMPKERELGKRARHALNYGMQWKLFYRTVNADSDLTGVSITQQEAKDIHDAYHNLHPQLHTWWGDVNNKLRHGGALWTPFGRRRIFFGRRRGDGWLDDTHREAIAYVPQSTVADLLNRGLLRWWKSHDIRSQPVGELSTAGLGRFVLQVHDSVLVEAPVTRLPSAKAALKQCLTETLTINDIKLTIPADVTASKDSWGKMR